MSRFREGQIVRTSYNTGPYKILEVEGDCACPSFNDQILLGMYEYAPLSRSHSHLLCRKIFVGKYDKPNDKYYLNGYDENLQSVWSDDYLIIEGEETLLLWLFT